MAEPLTDRKIEWTEVDGWLTVQEGAALRVLATGKRVLELGTYKGRSAICMAEVAEIVTTVDHHKGDRNTGPGDSFREFADNVERAGVEYKVDWWNCSVAEFDACVDREDYDLAFVDVEHSVACTTEALKLALKCVRPGGVIAWHDADRPDVRAAVAAVGLHPLASVGSLEWCKV